MVAKRINPTNNNSYMNIDNIPTELKTSLKWLPHKDKLPSRGVSAFGVRQATPVKWSDDTQWLTFDQALQVYQDYQPHLDGLIALLTPDTDIAVIDLDKYKTHLQTTQPLVDYHTQTYTEISPSGNGLHIWFKTTPTTHPYNILTKPPIELYPSKSRRVMTITGNLLTPTTSTTLATLPDLPTLAHALAIAHTNGQQLQPHSPHSPHSPYYQLPDAPILEGGRNPSLTSYLGKEVKKDANNEQTLTQDKLLTLAHRFNKKYNQPPLDDKEVASTTRSIWAKANKDRLLANQTMPPSPSSKLPADLSKPIDLTLLETLYKLPLTSLSTDNAHAMLLASLVHVIASGEFYNLVTHTACSYTSLETSWGAKLGAKNNKTSAAKLVWRNSPKRLEADDYGWRPVPYPIEPENRIYMDGTVKLLNTFQYKCKPTKGNVKPWLDLLDHLIEEPQYRLAVLWYFARLIQKPHIKQNWHLVIFGIQGAGKDSLLAPFNNILPMRTATSNDIKGQYDDHLHQTKLLVLNEAKLNHDMVNEYKRLAASDSVSTRTLNIKGKKKLEQVDVVNVVILSNDPGAVALDKDERRALVLRARNKLPPEQAIQYYQWLDNGGAAHLFDHLLTIDLRDSIFAPILINETETPYKTQYLYNMADLNKEDYELDVQEILDAYEHDVVSDELILKIFHARNKGKGYDEKYLNVVRNEARVALQKSNKWYQWGVGEGRDRQVQKKEGGQVLRKPGKPFVRKKSLLELKPVDVYDKLDEIEQIFKLNSKDGKY